MQAHEKTSSDYTVDKQYVGMGFCNKKVQSAVLMKSRGTTSVLFDFHSSLIK